MMKKNDEFENILDECLQKLIEGGSIESCLAQYPQYASELEPLLRTVQGTLKAADIRPRPEFRDRARYQFQKAIQEMPVKESRGFFTWMPRWATAVSIVVIVLLAGGGTVAASFNSVPGEPLYQVKLATESVRLAFTWSDIGKAELNAAFANERVKEIIRMAEKGDATLIAETTDRMNRQLLAVASLTGAVEATAEGARFNAMVATTAAPTPTALPTPVPSPTPTTGLTAPEITVPPAPQVLTTLPPPAAPEEGSLGLKHGPGAEATTNDNAGGAQGAGSEQQKLRDTLISQSQKNLQDLQDQLDKAPESLKPALRYAIEVAARAYENALEMLGD
jgi:hypothetical protein